MKSNADLTKEIIQKTKAARKKKHIVVSSLVLCICTFLGFFVGFSNIITIDFNPYETSYVSYLRAYASSEEQVGFRFVDDRSAIVQLENKAYPCAYEAKSKHKFTLSVVEEDEESQSARDATQNDVAQDEPSMFYLEFWDTNAKLSWNILGTKIEKILSITNERNIPAGLWSLCATQKGDDGEIIEKPNGAGWTLILENGDSYTGEGMDSAWKTKFISIGDSLFQCMFDPISGVILDASVFVYDETTFDYPVIRENYVSDGDPYYFYSRLLSDEEKLDFYGGELTASAVVHSVENHQVETPSKLHKEIAKWQLLPEKSQEQTRLSLSAQLSLHEDGTVQLKMTGENDYDGTWKGKWYALRHCVLVTLDKKSELLGKVFTVYASSGVEAPTGTFVQEYGQSRMESYGCYKTGYHVFDYFVSETHTEIFWGSKYTPEKLTATLQYETEYVLSGEYYYEYFDGDPNVANANRENFNESFLVPLPVNGQVTVVFHEDGTLTVTHADGSMETRKYTFTEDGGRVKFNWPVDAYQGKNAVGKNPWYPENVDENCIVQLNRFDVGFTYLYSECVYNWSYVYKDENGKFVQNDYSITYYRIYLTPKF